MTTRQIQIRRLLLGILNDADGNLVPEETVHVYLGLQCKPKPVLSETNEVIARMEKANEVFRLSTTEGIKTKITDLGRAIFLEG